MSKLDVTPKLANAVERSDKKKRKQADKASNRIKKVVKKLDKTVTENLITVLGYHAGVLEIGKRIIVRKNKTSAGTMIAIEILTDEGVKLKKAQQDAKANQSPFPMRDAIIGQEEKQPAVVAG